MPCSSFVALTHSTLLFLALAKRYTLEWTHANLVGLVIRDGAGVFFTIVGQFSEFQGFFIVLTPLKVYWLVP